MSARLCASYEKHDGKDFVPFGYPHWADLKGKEVIFGAFFMRSRGHPAVPAGQASCPRLQVPFGFRPNGLIARPAQTGEDR
jgi:hypothetical protein